MDQLVLAQKYRLLVLLWVPSYAYLPISVEMEGKETTNTP